MGIEKLTPHQALKPGCQVWVLPEKSVSQWSRYLDWHLHFLISKLDQKQQKRLDDLIERTLSYEEINLDLNLQIKYDSVLLSTQDYLPNKCTVVIRNYKSPEQWVEKILQLQKNLQNKSIRVFLPAGCDAQQFVKASKKEFEDLIVTITEDSKVIQ